MVGLNTQPSPKPHLKSDLELPDKELYVLIPTNEGIPH
jgi:hypothetical protein